MSLFVFMVFISAILTLIAANALLIVHRKAGIRVRDCVLAKGSIFRRLDEYVVEGKAPKIKRIYQTSLLLLFVWFILFVGLNYGS